VTAAIPFVVGVVFALGLGLSGMTMPAKVIGFLDVSGAWDPTLLFVMGGAVVGFGVVYRLASRRRAPLFGGSFPDLARGAIDRRLLAGAAVFGVGWGISGVCPGPGFVSLASGAWAPVVFVAAMFAGMAVVRGARG
jgi:uncharacterized membrane protein YedE/YeeE